MGNTGYFEKSILIGREASWGIIGTASASVPFSEESFGKEIPNENIAQTWANRDIRKTVQKSGIVAPSLSFDIEPENGIGEILKCTFGASTSTQFGTFSSYKHVFNVTNVLELPSLFARVQQYGTFSKDYTGLRVNTLELSWNKNDIVKCSVGFIGKDELNGTAFAGTFGTIQPFTAFGNVTALIDGTANTDIQSAKLKFDNKLTPQVMLGTNKSVGNITAGIREITGELTLFFNGETERNKFINKTTLTLQVNAQGGTFTSSGTAKHEMNVKFPNVEYVAFPWENQDGVLAATVPFKAIYSAGNSVGTNSIVAELQNSIASYL